MRLIAKIPTMVRAYQLIAKPRSHSSPATISPIRPISSSMITGGKPRSPRRSDLSTPPDPSPEHSSTPSTFQAPGHPSTLTTPTRGASQWNPGRPPASGAANERLLAMLEEIGTEDQVEPYR